MGRKPRRASAPLYAVVARPARRPEPKKPPTVPLRLQLVAGYTWRLIIILIAVYLAFVGLAKVELAVVAVFGAFVITALLRPLVEPVARLVPRPAAVAVSIFAAIVIVAALFAFIGFSVAGQAGAIIGSFNSGISRLTRWLEQGPLHIRHRDVTRAADRVRTWVGQHQGEFAGDILGGAGATAKGLTGFLVAVFCSIFFLSSGSTMWSKSLTLLPERARESASEIARAGWSTFEGYVRGTIIVAASNALIVAVLLVVLRVPLALPLATLVFIASFIPIVGGALSLAVAAVVAFAARGPTVALIVIIVVPILGQIEGHVLQPLIMSRSVNLHPVVVILTVVSGGLIGGLLGAVLAVPIVAVTWSVISAFRRRSDR